jgi:hypothetical protein
VLYLHCPHRRHRRFACQDVARKLCADRQAARRGEECVTRARRASLLSMQIYSLSPCMSIDSAAEDSIPIAFALSVIIAKLPA